MNPPTFLCPDCKVSLVDLNCPSCGATYESKNGIAILLPRDKKYASVVSIASFYDDFYSGQEGVWEDQGRTPQFIRYFADLVLSHAPNSVFEVGCGEGRVLAALSAPTKSGADLSWRACEKAEKSSNAKCFVATCERLPLPDASYDAVLSIGVMEHFIDDLEATREIARIIKDQGRYVFLIHTRLTTAQKLLQKFREYLFPRPRLIALSKWIFKKLTRPSAQPIQRGYTIATATACVESAGLRIERIIRQNDAPRGILIGPHVVIFETSKS